MSNGKSYIAIKVAIFINYFVFALILNSVGILIAKSISAYGVDEIQASTLELFKDASIALVSFFIGSFLPRLGYKKAILTGLTLVFIGCIIVYKGNSFVAVRTMFACVGIAFAVVKVSIFALIGLITSDHKSHSSFMSSIESMFMLGIASAYILFPLFYSDTNPDQWLNIYLLIAALTALAWMFVFFSKFDFDYEIPGSSVSEDFKQMIQLFKNPMVAVFAICAFMYVMMEQGIMSWLPTFNETVLHLPEKISVNMAVIMALSIAAGRYLSGQLVKRVTWIFILQFALIGAALTVLFVLPLTKNLEAGVIQSLKDVPLVAFVFPLIGLFFAPIYPLMNSTVLGATDKKLHSGMAGILTFFSATGGVLGSMIMAYLFKKIGGSDAFFYALIPMGLLSVALLLLFGLTRSAQQS